MLRIRICNSMCTLGIISKYLGKKRGPGIGWPRDRRLAGPEGPEILAYSNRWLAFVYRHHYNVHVSHPPHERKNVSVTKRRHPARPQQRSLVFPLDVHVMWLRQAFKAATTTRKKTKIKENKMPIIKDLINSINLAIHILRRNDWSPNLVA